MKWRHSGNRQDIQAYPKIEDGQVVLQNDPTPRHSSNRLFRWFDFDRTSSEPDRSILMLSNMKLRRIEMFLKRISVFGLLISETFFGTLHATQCRDIEALSDVDLRGSIDNCKRARLPFNVAVERRVRTCGR
jgi:hypothetical protein